jgi:hypothetical protein
MSHDEQSTIVSIASAGAVRTDGPPARPVFVRRGVPAAVVLLAAAALFFCYWRQSQSVPLSSDGASNVLQAWDMLHGNLLLHNWWVSDVSFYTTELPQYMLIEAMIGLGASVVHAAAAMTYTLIVLLGGWLAKGEARGRKGIARALLAAALMLSPQLSATPILLLAPNHTGTAVPLLAIWLVIDRLSPRWYVPPLVFLMIIWATLADTVILITLVVPLVLTCAVRAFRRRTLTAPRWYEPSLAAAAAAGGALGWRAPRLVAALGGYHQAAVDTSRMPPGQWGHGAWVAFQALLELFGGNVLNAGPAAGAGFVAVHLAGVLLVIVGVLVAFARFFRAELIVPAFAVAIGANMAAYLVSPHALDVLGAREMAAVLPLGAVLAGRALGDHVPGRGWLRRWLLRPALVLAAAGYLAALAYGAAQPPVPPANQQLADWLPAHGLTDGLAGYWEANSTTLDSGGRVTVSAVAWTLHDGLGPYLWEADASHYDPSRRYANFLVAGGTAPLPAAQAVTWAAGFGPPKTVYHVAGYVIMVWDTNLLSKLGTPSS